jgi:hypothetical protein
MIEDKPTQDNEWKNDENLSRALMEEVRQQATRPESRTSYLDELKSKIKLANAELRALCHGKRFAMHIPVQLTDPDIVIGDGLMAWEKVISRLETAEADLAFHPRAAKLIHKRKNFVLVAEDEPYFMDVYTLIKLHELYKGTWTVEDERLYQEALAKSNRG